MRNKNKNWPGIFVYSLRFQKFDQFYVCFGLDRIHVFFLRNYTKIKKFINVIKTCFSTLSTARNYNTDILHDQLMAREFKHKSGTDEKVRLLSYDEYSKTLKMKEQNVQISLH